MPKQKITEKDFAPHLDQGAVRVAAQEKIKDNFWRVADFYGFSRIVPSGIEHPRLYTALMKNKFLGEYAPVVGKTKQGLEFALLLSHVLSILRMYVPHKMNDLPHPLKFSFSGNGFFLEGNRRGIAVRREWGLLMIGEDGPIAEAEIMQVVWRAMNEMGVSGGEFRINATGCGECRPAFRTAFLGYIRSRVGQLCRSCRAQVKKTPTKILFCVEDRCAALLGNAPQVLNFLCDRCSKHLKELLEFLDEMKIPYFLDHRLFREGTWFSAFVFEFVGNPLMSGAMSVSPDSAGVDQGMSAVQSDTEALPGAVSSGESRSAKKILAEGGRVDRAAELIAGRKLDTACVTVFLDAVESYLGNRIIVVAEILPEKVFLAQLGELAKKKSFAVIEILRRAGIPVAEILGRDSIKSQLKVAERLGIKLALIIGQKEAIDGTVIVREVSSAIQETMPQDKLVEFLRRKLKK